MKTSTIATALNFIVPGSGLWYCGKRMWGVANLLLASVIVSVLVGHPVTGERIHYVMLAVAAGAAGWAHSVASQPGSSSRSQKQVAGHSRQKSNAIHKS